MYEWNCTGPAEGAGTVLILVTALVGKMHFEGLKTEFTFSDILKDYKNFKFTIEKPFEQVLMKRKLQLYRNFTDQYGIDK